MSSYSPLSFLYYTLRGLGIGQVRPFRFLPAFDNMQPREKFEHYLRHHLYARLGFVDVEIEYIGQRHNPLVARITGVGENDCLVRCFQRNRKAKSFEHASVSRLLRNAGISVPKMIYFDTGSHTLGRYGFDIVVEEYIAGRHVELSDFQSMEPDENTPEHSANVLQQLAKILEALHGCMSPVSGRPWRSGARRFSNNSSVESTQAVCETREQVLMERVKQCDWLKTEQADLSRLSQHFEQARSRIDCGGSYRLIHGDLQAMNLMLRVSDEQMTLIDFGTVRYDYWPWDFVVFHNGSAQENARITADLLALYKAESKHWDLDFFESCWSYMAPWYHLEKTASSIRKYKRGRGDKKNGTDFQTRARHHFKRALEALDEPSPLEYSGKESRS